MKPYIFVVFALSLFTLACVEPPPGVEVQKQCSEDTRIVVQDALVPRTGWQKYKLYCLQKFDSKTQKVYVQNLGIEQETPVLSWHHVKCSEKPLTCD